MAKKKELSDDVFRFYVEFCGFDIDAFDKWLAGLEACGAKTELQQRRQLAKEAVSVRPPNTQTLNRHLEWMMLRWRMISREDVILPKAKIGQAFSSSQSEKGRKGLETRWASDERRNVDQVIETLALKRDALGDPLKPSELWEEFYSSLDDERLGPEEIEDKKDKRRSLIKYDGGEITRHTFENRISKARKTSR